MIFNKIVFENFFTIKIIFGFLYWKITLFFKKLEFNSILFRSSPFTEYDSLSNL
jgi:hypothetical protein